MLSFSAYVKIYSKSTIWVIIRKLPQILLERDQRLLVILDEGLCAETGCSVMRIKTPSSTCALRYEACMQLLGMEIHATKLLSQFNTRGGLKRWRYWVMIELVTFTLNVSQLRPSSVTLWSATLRLRCCGSLTLLLSDDTSSQLIIRGGGGNSHGFLLYCYTWIHPAL